MLMDGIHIPLTVPFTREGESYLRKLEYNVGRYSLTPAAGLVALTGEGAGLSDVETAEALRVIGAAAGREKVLVASIARESVRGALTVADEAAGAGFDAVLLHAPVGISRDEVLVYFRAVADRSALPVMLGSLPVEMVVELTRHANVIGMYADGLKVEWYREIVAAAEGVVREVVVTTVFAPVTRRMVTQGVEGFVTAASLSGGAAVAAAPGIKTRVKKVGFQVMAAGSARGVVELLEAGVAGAMVELAACAPQGVYEAFAAFKDGDRALAAEKESRLMEADAVVLEVGVAGVKYGCDLNGYFGGAPRLPRLPLDAEGRVRVERVLAGIRN